MEMTGRGGGWQTLTDGTQSAEVFPALGAVDSRTAPGVDARRPRRRLVTAADELTGGCLADETRPGSRASPAGRQSRRRRARGYRALVPPGAAPRRRPQQSRYAAATWRHHAVEMHRPLRRSLRVIVPWNTRAHAPTTGRKDDAAGENQVQYNQRK